MRDTTESETGAIPCNYSFLFYDHPVYSSNLVYGIDRTSEEKAAEENEPVSDEPIESWGWVNNVDKDF